MSVLSLPALLLATLLTGPAIWRYSQDQLPFDALVLRYALITLACLAAGAVVRRWLDPSQEQPAEPALAQEPVATDEPALEPTPA